MPQLLIRGQWGLGDNIFQRPFIKQAARKYDLFLDTPWPELFEDTNVRFVRSSRALRAQTKNIERQPAARWIRPPRNIREVRTGYSGHDLEVGSIVRTLERQFSAVGANPDPLVFDLPEMGRSPVNSDKPIAVIRPVTVRTEWRNEARSPLPEYVNWIAGELRKTHHVVAVADLKPKEEWLLGDKPPHDEAFWQGELNVRSLLALIRSADVVVGGVGWIVPAAIALKTKAFIILGGHGAHNAPEKITDPRMELSRIGFAMPERFCRCTAMLHRCDKRIPNLAEQWRSWSNRVGLLSSISAPRAA